MLGYLSADVICSKKRTVFLLMLLFSPLAATFKQVAKTVTDVNLRDNVVDVVYKMFDENGKPADLTCILIRIILWMMWMSG